MLVNVLQKLTAFTRDAIGLASGEDISCLENVNIFSSLRQEFSMWIHYLEIWGNKCKCSHFTHVVLAV